jgi:hypothetical protein
MTNPFSSALNLVSNTIGNTTSSLVSDVSDGVLNSTTAAITGVPNCTYKSTFISTIDRNKYGIVSNPKDVLKSVGCICQYEDNTSINKNAVKIENYIKNPLPEVSSEEYICQIPPK